MGVTKMRNGKRNEKCSETENEKMKVSKENKIY